MCTTTIVTVGSTFGTYSFSDGIKVRRQLTTLEWARRDFDACMAYLFKHHREEEAELIFEILVRTQVPRPD
jgi:hypothetical protein